MDINQIKQYKHKIRIININNVNKHSTYKYVIARINLCCADDEVIRFSLSENDDFIEHQHVQQKNNSNDYYCYIPNKLNQTTTLYAHFFPSDLYSYENELDTIVFPFNFTELDDNTTTSTRYKQYIDNDTLVVQSTDSTSVTGDHDPNYKNYTTTNNSNKTEQGKFPLSSKYRSKQNWKVPNLQDSNPKWDETNGVAPYWETKIPTEWSHTPMNVYLNYEYLPTSRKYHQHYFGFEPTTANNTTTNVLEGTNLNVLDNKFGSDNNYRLIHLNNPYNDEYSMHVNHDSLIPIDLGDFFTKYNNNKQSCQWSKNKCEDYYIYTPLDSSALGYCVKQIDLQKGKYYSLEYYMYIPSYATIGTNECYITIETEDNVFTIPSEFIDKDRNLRDQWIYHEIPFIASEHNTIKIIGPQSTNAGRDYNNSVYFINMYLRMYTEYTPTLQYTNTGIHLAEQDQSAYMPLSVINTTSQAQTITPDNKEWIPTDLNLPKPYNDVRILVNGDSETLHGVYGPNNSFSFKFIGDNDEFVNNGTVEVGIFMTQDRVSDIGGAELKLTKKATNVKGVITFNNINLSKLPDTTNNKYYIRLEYKDPCRDISKIVFKELFVEKEEIVLGDVKINNSLVNHQNKNIVQYGYIINETDEFPMQIKLHIQDQQGHNKTTGYCELSIDDTVHQTTIVDDGWVDFYFNPSDFKVGTHTIKIEYYREYFNALAFIYFDLTMPDGLDFKDSVLIEIKRLYFDGTTRVIGVNTSDTIVDHDDCVLQDITMNGHNRFRIEIYRNDVLFLKQNVYSSDVEITFLDDKSSNQEANTFRIVTGNMHDENGHVTENLWKDYERTFTIRYAN